MRMVIYFMLAIVFGGSVFGVGCRTIEKTEEVSMSMVQKSELGIEDVFQFLKRTQHYFLATVDEDQPRVRPFGTVLLYEGKLYIQTGRKKKVAKQILKNGKVELCAFDGKEWLRVSGTLIDDKRAEVRAAMLDAHPSLKSMYKADDENTMVLYFKDATAVFESFQNGVREIHF